MDITDLPKLEDIYGELQIEDIRIDLTYPLYLVYFTQYRQELDDDRQLVRAELDPQVSRFQRSLDTLENLRAINVEVSTELIHLALAFKPNTTKELDCQLNNVMGQFEDVVGNWNDQARIADIKSIEWFNEQALAPSGSLDFETLAEEMF